VTIKSDESRKAQILKTALFDATISDANQPQIQITSGLTTKTEETSSKLTGKKSKKQLESLKIDNS